MSKLHIDIETYSSVDIKKSGAYKYTESLDFEVLMFAYAFDNEPVMIVDLAQGCKLPVRVAEALTDPNIEKWAHNAVFERLSITQMGFDLILDQWHCSAVLATYSGWPRSLGDISKAMKLDSYSKSKTGTALIKYFSCPVKATKVNGGRVRNFPHHDLDKWQEFKDYCMQDVEAEREITSRLSHVQIGDFERENYLLDQRTNDKGIRIDEIFADRANTMVEELKEINLKELKELTGLDNPNSPAQLKDWIGGIVGRKITTLAKDTIPNLIEEAGHGVVSDVLHIPNLIEEAGHGVVSDVLHIRAKASKTSLKKYTAAQNCVCDNGRAHGLFQYYGANRTGRWAGRLIQLQNLPQNHIGHLEQVREIVRRGDLETLRMLYDNSSDALSQLIRTMFVPKDGHIFMVADFSAIEARVIAWLAGEQWRIDVFNTHGKIYEASAAMMFGVPVEEITKGSDLRAKGKVAELALGFGGSVGALAAMGAERMGLSKTEMKAIVDKWRKANPSIAALWKDVEKYALRAMKFKGTKFQLPKREVYFEYSNEALAIQLPSGRKLYYAGAHVGVNKWGFPGLFYKGMIQATHKWGDVDTYGGKLVENIVQAIARDLLAEAMLRLDNERFNIVMHVHDEVVCEVPTAYKNYEGVTFDHSEEALTFILETMCDIMGARVDWAQDLNTPAEGFISEFYKKD